MKMMHGSIYGLCVVLILTSPLACCDQTLHLLSVLPYRIQNASLEEQPSYSEGPALFIAAKLAVDRINKTTDLLPDYKVELVRSDGGCNLLTKVEEVLFRDILYSDKNIQGVVGPGCSHSTLALGSLIARPNVDLLSISIAGTVELFNRTRYANSFSSIDSSQVYVDTIETIITNQNWENVTVIHDLSRPFFNSLANELMDLDDNSGFSFHFLGVLPPGDLSVTPIATLPNMCPPESRIIVFLSGQELIRNILCLFLRYFSTEQYPTYQYIIINHTPDSIIQETQFEYNGTNITCTSEDMEEFLSISIFIQYRLGPFVETLNTSTGLTPSQFDKEYSQRVAEYNAEHGTEIEKSVFGTAYFDATWALVLALNNSRDEVREKTGLDLADYRYGDRNATDIIRRHLLELDFDGVSGNIKFNETTGFVKHLIDIYQYRERLAYYESSSRQIINYNESQGVRYEQDSFIFVPISLPAVGISTIILMLLLTAAVICLHVLHNANIDHPSIKSTHPKLYVFVFCGIYLEAAGTILFIIGDTLLGLPGTEYHHCNLRYVGDMFRNTGRVLFFSSLSVIAYRVYRIFVHYMKPGKLISDFYLTGFVVIVTSLYFVVHCALTVVLLPKANEVCTEVVGNRVSGQVRCSIDRESIPWVVIIDAVPPLVLSALSALFSTLVTCRGRIKIEQFKNNPILVVSYLFLLNSALWIAYAVIETVMEDPDNDLQLITNLGSTTINISFVLIFLFLPPTLPIIRECYSARLKPHVSPRWQRTKERFSLCGCTCANEQEPTPEANQQDSQNSPPVTVDSTGTNDTQETTVSVILLNTQNEAEAKVSKTNNSVPTQTQTVYSGQECDIQDEPDTIKVDFTQTINTLVEPDTVIDTQDVVHHTEELSHNSRHHKHSDLIQVTIEIR